MQTPSPVQVMTLNIVYVRKSLLLFVQMKNKNKTKTRKNKKNTFLMEILHTINSTGRVKKKEEFMLTSEMLFASIHYLAPLLAPT